MAVSADRADRLARMAADRGLRFPILLDPEAQVIKALGVYNRRTWFRGDVPHPALVVVDREGQIVHHELKKSLLRRFGPDHILAVLDALPAQAPAES